MKSVTVPMRKSPTAQPSEKPADELPARSKALANQRRELEQELEVERARNLAAELERQRQMSRLD